MARTQNLFVPGRVMKNADDLSASVQSVDRALELLDLLSNAAPDGLQVTAIARFFGIHKATVSRLLKTLVSRGYAAKLPGGRYALGPRSLRLAPTWCELARKVWPGITELARVSGESVFLTQLVGRDAVSVACATARFHRVRVVEEQHRFPLWASAAGKALLSQLPAVARVELLPPEPYPSLCKNTSTRWAELNTSIEEGLQTGVFRESGEMSSAFDCYAAAIRVPGRPETLSMATVFQSGLEKEGRRELWRLVRAAKQDIEKALM